MREKKPLAWVPQVYNYSEIFSDLELILSNQYLPQWPNCQQLMVFLEQGLCNCAGLPISLVAQDDNLPYPEMSYEERIYKTGIISTRENNWHDFFNTMIWVLFPESKKLLNLLHIKEMENQASSHRTIGRDAITHLDESGIIIVSSEQSLIDALRHHQWMDVFYQQRELWIDDLPFKQKVSKQIAAFIFGHGMYEKSLHPFIGLTGKMYAIKVEKDFFNQDKLQQYQQLDQFLAADIKLTQTLKNNQKLSPLPVLGIPGWFEQNKQQSFYQNQDYFRAVKN